MDVVTLQQAAADAKNKYGRGALMAAKFGVSKSASATANTAALNTAIAAAIAAGADLLLPPLHGTDRIEVNDQINVTAPLRILSAGDSPSRIHQNTKPKPIFYVTAPDVAVHNVRFYGDGLDMTGMTDPVTYAAYAGIWFGPGSDNHRATRIYGEGLHRAIRVDPDPTTVNPAAVNISKSFIYDLEGKDCWCVLTVAQATDPMHYFIRGNSKKATATDATDVGQPDHTVYYIDRSGSGRYNVNPSYGQWKAYGSEIGKAFAVKGIIGGSGRDLSADNCHGLLDNLSNADHNIYNIVSTNDVYPQTGTESAFASVSYSNAEPSTRSHIYGASVEFAHMDHGKAYLLDGTYNEIHDASATGNLVTESVATSGATLFGLKGTKNRFCDPLAASVGANMWAAYATTGTGQQGAFINPRSVGNFKFGVVNTSHDDCTIEYDPILLETNGKLNGATDLTTGAKAIAVGSGTVNRPKIRPRDRQIPNGPENIIYERGTDAAFSGHAGRATSGQAASTQTGSFTCDLTDGRGRVKNTNTSTTVPGVMLFSTAREAVDTATPNFSAEMEVIPTGTNALAIQGIAFRGSSGTDTLGLGFTGTGHATPQLQLFKLDSGVVTVLGAPFAGAAIVGRKYVLKVVCFGNVIQCYLDGALVITYTLTGGDITKYAALTTAGYYCIAATTTLFGEFTVKRMA